MSRWHRIAACGNRAPDLVVRAASEERARRRLVNRAPGLGGLRFHRQTIGVFILTRAAKAVWRSFLTSHRTTRSSLALACPPTASASLAKVIRGFSRSDFADTGDVETWGRSVFAKGARLLCSENTTTKAADCFGNSPRCVPEVGNATADIQMPTSEAGITILDIQMPTSGDGIAILDIQMPNSGAGITILNIQMLTSGAGITVLRILIQASGAGMVNFSQKTPAFS